MRKYYNSFNVICVTSCATQTKIINGSDAQCILNVDILEKSLLFRSLNINHPKERKYTKLSSYMSLSLLYKCLKLRYHLIMLTSLKYTLCNERKF